MEFVLVGQPYGGRSTIFNEVAGYRAGSKNQPGAVEDHAHGEVELDGERAGLVDLPGIYSLQLSDDAADPAVEHLLEAPPDTVIVNVVDASVLSRSLELTLQIAELGRPYVVALNMMDEARRKGVRIHVARLSEILGVPVVETVARSGEGIRDLFRAALRAGHEARSPAVVPAPPRLEEAIGDLVRLLADHVPPGRFGPRLLAIKLIERDPTARRLLDPHLPKDVWPAIEARLAELEATTGQATDDLMSAARHTVAYKLFEKVAVVRSTGRRDLRDRLDDVFMHPVLGYVVLIAVLAASFALVFRVGNAVEPVFLDQFDRLAAQLAARLGEGTLAYAVVHGIVAGLGGGVGIVVPYLLPFFVVLAVLEDSGYLPRIACLLDNLMHRIGLHGTSVLPLVMGYGCSVPGILATRVLKGRDRLITAALTTLIPCSARMTLIFGLVGFYISLEAALLIYVVDLLIIGLAGKVMSTFLPDDSPALILEIPRYHLPGPVVVAKKTWFRLEEFIVIVWPLLVVGSVVLELIDFYDLSASINGCLAPYTVQFLGFPAAVGITFLFGILRKELALVLLFAALGTTDIDLVMTRGQIVAYTFFATFYLPCLATFAALAKVVGVRNTAVLGVVTLTVISLLTAGISHVFG
ncbi:MAG: ferrous iron transport protein B [Deltaproteobacteria bacterium]|nr:ferrous iron transport protein B [Deltaproteobacteria bacterium]